MSNGNPPTERIEANRCKSNVVEKPGHTHWCRITVGHEDEHRCICSRQWSRAS